MLLKHSALYMAGRGIPAVLNFAAIAIYTRLLPPADYGRYSLVMSSAALINVLFFQWLRISLVRFLPAYADTSDTLVASVFLGAGVLSIFSGAVGLVLSLVWPDPSWKGAILVGTVLVLAQAWFELSLELARARLDPVRYGVMNGMKSAVSLLVGMIATVLGLGLYGPLVGQILGMTLATLGCGWRISTKLGVRWSLPFLKELFGYGFPLSITAVLAFFVHASDRFFIRAFLDESSVGTYSVGYDLAQQTLTLVFMTINLAATPIAITALERHGIKAAFKQFVDNGKAFFLTTVPMAVGLIVFDRYLLSMVVPDLYLNGALQVFPWIVICAWLQGIKSYYIDSAFYLAKKTSWQVWTVVPSAVSNAVFNYLLIPTCGMLGAAYSTLIAYALALGLSVMMAWKIWRSFALHTAGSRLLAKGGG